MATKHLFLILILAVASTAGCKKKSSGGEGETVAAAASAPAGSAGECKACELGSKHRACTAEYLTASRDGAGQPVAGTFGCETLSGAAAQQACDALLTCIKKNRCSTNANGTEPGDNPSVGCFCGKTAPTTCLGGTDLNGPCVAAYKAAATASKGGPAAGAADSAFAAFIGEHAFDATTPIGLADDVAQCAIDAPCPACMGS
jgi:hypothetical protein